MRRYLKSSEEDLYLDCLDDMVAAIAAVCEEYAILYQRRGLDITQGLIENVMEKAKTEVIEDFSY